MIAEGSDIEKNLKGLATYLEDLLKAELEAQGHNAGGKLKDSIKVTLSDYSSGIGLEGRSEFYGRFVDTGRKAGVRRVPLDALLAWMRLRGISAPGMKERDLAFAIQNAIFKQGIPTSRDMNRRYFVTNTLKNHQTDISGRMKEAIGAFFAMDIHNIITDVKTRVYGG